MEELNKRAAETKEGESFTMELPLVFMDFAKCSLPNVWPLEGTVSALRKMHFNDHVNPSTCFPPCGHCLEVAFYREKVLVRDVERFNMDGILLAFFQKLVEKGGQEGRHHVHSRLLPSCPHAAHPPHP